MTTDAALAIQAGLEPVAGLPLLEGYPAAFRVLPRVDHYDSQGHLNNVATIRIFQDLRVTYMGALVGRREVGRLTADHVIGVRELVTTYVTEAHPGEQLYAGCRVLGRSRRAYMFDEVLTTDDRVVSRLRLLECVISDGRAIEIPAPFWAAIEAVEGRAMPVRELPMGRTPWEAT